MLGITVVDVTVEAAEESGPSVPIPAPAADAEQFRAELAADGRDAVPDESVPGE